MVVDERSRHELFQQLERTLGEEAAATLMEHLPPVGWADVATRRDLDGLRAEMQAGFTLARQEAKAEIAGVRAEITGVRDEVRAEIAGLHAEIAGVRDGVQTEIAGVRGEMNGLRADFRGEINAATTAQTRTIMFSMLGAILGHGGLVLAALQLS
jgi:hypothetical protein